MYKIYLLPDQHVALYIFFHSYLSITFIYLYVDNQIF